MTPMTKLLWCAAGLLLAGAGCKSPEKPAAPAPPAPAQEAPVVSLLDATLEAAGATLPQVAGAPATEAPTLEDSWARRTVVVGPAEVSVSNERVMTLACPDGAASCAAPEGAPRTGWKPLIDAVGERPASLLAVDAALPIGVAAGALVALRGEDQPAWLVRSGDGLGAIPLRAAPRLLAPPLTPTATMGSLPRGELLARLQAEAESSGAVEGREPPRAPGELVRVTTGALAVPAECGGVDAARTIRRRLGSLRGCYREARQRTPGASGVVEVSLTLLPDRRLGGTKLVRNETGDEALGACFARALDGTTLPALQGGGTCNVTWEITLRTEAEALKAPTAPEGDAANPLHLQVKDGTVRVGATGGAPSPTVELTLVDDGVRVGEGAPMSLGARQALVDAIRAAKGDRVEALVVAPASAPTERVLNVAAAALGAGLVHVELEVSP